ncbi:hypothetical protein [Bradyrhizobium murdochi]|uniref:hypothetical protein n=1 Tax=Bradyrhizobium murdochi TaxID=1038859 RepID=UPI0004153FB1|nr:hypothetical protein [Bradyrhizobium murdochi]
MAATASTAMWVIEQAARESADFPARPNFEEQDREKQNADPRPAFFIQIWRTA